MSLRLVPAIAESQFRFPTESFYDTLRPPIASSLMMIDGLTQAEAKCRAADVVTALKNVFKEIAIEVNPQDHQVVLECRICALAARLTATAPAMHPKTPIAATEEETLKIDDDSQHSL